MTGLFGTTGVRKVYGSEFTLDMAMKLGKALGSHLEEGTVLVARDGRTTGRMVADAFSAGVLSTGVSVKRAGIIPTPTLAFMTREGGFSAGAMITASHNPPEYTGIKFWSSDSTGYTSEEEDKIAEFYFSENFRSASWDSLGETMTIDNAADEHIKAIISKCDQNLIESGHFKVVVDPGNGAACVLTPYLVRRLGCRVITINGQLDGHFPGRKSEPEQETLGDLIRTIQQTDANLGIAHDGDSDRVVFVTEKGEVIRGDRIIALLATEMVPSSKNKTVVTTVDSSKVLDETVKSLGGTTIRTPVGDIQVAVKVKETAAVLGGEAAGVFIFPAFHFAPEPFLAICRILEMMARHKRSLGDLISDIPIYSLLKAKIECPNNRKGDVMQTLAEELPSGMPDVVEVLTVDGIGLSLKDGWALVRPSGTEPVIRVTCEGSSDEVTERILQGAKSIVEKAISK
ncbi:MAG: phosphoglucosamine mutase [Candidatus Thorarchaeota archaeon]|nr:MAG: phosphoglucosamine mutase [Candidatus Thorarchaeota archaeon]